MLRRLALVVLALLATSGCERKRGEITGVGPYVLGETQLSQASGACSPDRSQTWCTSLGALQIGKQKASVDLYFDGHEDDARLVEILLAIRMCNAQSAASALEHKLGKPTEVLGRRIVWTGARAVIIANFESSAARECEVSFVHPSKTRTIEYLKTGVMPPKPGAEKKKADEAKKAP